jgi:hypothetical protein
MPQNKQMRTATLQRQKSRLESILNRLEGLDKRFILARVITFLSAVAAMIVMFFVQISWLALLILVFFIAIFAIIVFLHRRLDRGRLHFRLALSMVSIQLARMDLDWEGIPATSPIQVDPVHPFAADLDIVGVRSLHRLIDTATSLGGSQRLANWFLEPLPDLDAIRRRHAILQELIPLTGFRNRLALHGMRINEETKGKWDGEKLIQTLEESVARRSFLPTLGFLSILAVVNIVFFILNIGGILPPYWIIGLVFYEFVYMARYKDYRSLFAETYSLGKSLNQFRSVLVFLENASYLGTKRLAELCEPFASSEKRPSRFLQKIVWITIASSLGDNPFLSVIINAIVPWNLFFAYILNGYKKDLHDPLQEWLNVWYELEALCSLANFAWLNPEYVFPYIITDETNDGQEIYRARGLGHPLIPESRRVCNDYSIQKLGYVAIITGSNMSGKSTFLRTIGINMCLVNSGGPVAAVEMNTRLFRLFTCIQVSDSLSDGISYFYAEVRRLKQLLIELEKASQYQLFFLIDEIYRGTNNRERRIGSQAYIHALSNSNGVGVVSTHDLDLVQLSNLESNVLNYHFREEIKGNRMIYDYRLRPGPCPTTNALKIMEMEGLPVEDLGDKIKHE